MVCKTCSNGEGDCIHESECTDGKQTLDYCGSDPRIKCCVHDTAALDTKAAALQRLTGTDPWATFHDGAPVAIRRARLEAPSATTHASCAPCNLPGGGYGECKKDSDCTQDNG